jgi:O-antigen/teichoic acid export membrane protein
VLARHRGSRGARAIGFNLAGGLCPALLAVLTVPRVAAHLGTDRFGVLALAWAALGYAAFLHLGLGRALTQSTAGGQRGEHDTAALAWTVTALTLGLGALAGAALLLGAPWLVDHVLHVSAGLRDEAVSAFRVLALAAPFTVGAPALSGILEARYRFGLVNAVSIPVAFVTYLGPLAATFTGSSLVPVVAVLVAARALAWGGYLALALRVLPEMRRRPAFRRRELRPLLRYGGWSTLSTLVSPLMVSMDRFMVVAVLSVTATAYYATPQEVVLRLGLLSGAVVGFLFPAFAGARDEAREVALVERGIGAVFLLVVPATLVLGIYSAPLLRGWMGPDYARHGSAALAWLAVGLLVNGIAKVPSTLLQGVGRPDLTARLHLVELPVFVAVLYVLVRALGVEGAAIAWLVRVFVDGAALFWLLWRRSPRHGAAARRSLGLVAAAGAAVVAGRLLPPWASLPLVLAVSGWALRLVVAGRAGRATG